MYQFHDINAGNGGGVGVLTLDRALLRPVPIPAFGAKRPDWRGRLDDLSLLTDLGANVGSREWMRGFAICAALCYAAYSFAPGADPLPGAAPPRLADAQWEQARALSISPLAYGADTGRRMAATAAVEPLTDTPERPIVDLIASVGHGEGFADSLTRAGVGRNDAEQVAGLVGAAVPLDGVTPGTIVELTLGRRPSRQVARPLDRMAFRASFDLKLEVRRVGNDLRLVRIPIAVDDTPLRIEGRVGASLYRSARAAGASVKTVESFIRAIATQRSIGTISADDRFDMVVAHRRAATGETETGDLLYAGLDAAGGKKLQLMQWDKDGKPQWFEASGVGKQSGMFQRPVPGVVTSNYGPRMHPILGYTRMHKGVDFKAGYGTPILAAADGRVVRAGWVGGFGQQVRLDHASGLATSYSHMSRIAAHNGEFVHQGQVIGYVGATGLATGPHLHYEMYRNGQNINPGSVQFTMRAQLSGGELAGFRARLRRLLSLPVNGLGADARSARTDSAHLPARG